MSNLGKTLEEMRRTANALSNRPERQRQAEQHVRMLEHLLIHGNTHPRHPNLSSKSILKEARCFLMEYNDWGFALDDDAPRS
jgi:hypothetical protein